tara:strand:+ start:3099 stop:3326 length:228 start_codon:yes stop_codon:yes gene_type:complete
MNRKLLEAIADMQDEMDMDKREVRHQMSSHKKIELTPPNSSQGASGDVKLVETSGKVYQYIKIKSEWYKIELEKA